MWRHPNVTPIVLLICSGDVPTTSGEDCDDLPTLPLDLIGVVESGPRAKVVAVYGELWDKKRAYGCYHQVLDRYAVYAR